jgi:hypothetical protein
MSSFVKSAVLTLALLIGAAASAAAQSESIAALPPNASAEPPGATAAIGPTLSGTVEPRQPRDMWNDMAGAQPLAPSPFLGPAPNSDYGDDE